MSALALLACFVIGVISGTTNVLAAGGSFLTLPLLLFLGLPATVANGTNRVGVVMQNVVATWTFHRHGLIDWRWAWSAAAAALIGVGFGVWAALEVPEIAFRRVLSSVILLLTALTLLHRVRRVPRRAGVLPPSHPGLVVGLVATGFYGGFLQAGVGFILLALTSTAGLDLVRGNAIKVVMVLLMTLPSLGAFASTGHVDWPSGLALGLGNLTGGAIGARLAIAKGHAWLEQIVAVAAIVFAVMLWFGE